MRNDEDFDTKINQFPPKLRKILQFKLKSIDGFTLREMSEYTDTKYETVRHEIYLCNKKGLRFHEVMDEINKEILLGRKIALDEKFYNMVCESDDLEDVRKSIKTFYETQRLLQPVNKQETNIQNNISVPVSVKDCRPADIDDNCRLYH